MRRIALLRFVTALMALPACSSPPPPSDAGFDSPTTDTVVDTRAESTVDAPADVADVPPAPQPYSCMPCNYDFECGPGGICQQLSSTVDASLHSCVVACDTVGSACDAAGVAATCTSVGGAAPSCTPQRSCINSPRGMACPSTGCIGRYNVCGSPHPSDPAVCLPPCIRDSECENAFAHCRPVTPQAGGPSVMACVPDDIPGPSACGVRALDARGVGTPCGATGSPTCPTGTTCVHGVDPLVSGFCSATCATDGDCGGVASCLTVATFGNVCVPPDCACIAGTHDALLDTALTAGMRDRCNLYFADATIDIFGPNVDRDRFRLPIFDRIHRDWLAGTAYARALGPALDAQSHTLSSAIAAADALRTTSSTTGMVGPISTAPAGSSPLATATAAIIDAYGGTADMAMLTTAATSVPMALQVAVGAILVAILQTAQARDAGLLGVQSPDDVDYLYEGAPHLALSGTGITFNPTIGFDVGAILGDVVLPVSQTTGLAATIESIPWSTFRGMMGPTFTADTPLGTVVINDGGAQTYTAAAYPRTVFVLDLGGDDMYLAPVAANADSTNSVSVLVDLDGTDTYGYAPMHVAADGTSFLPSDGAGRYPSVGNQFSLSEIGRQGSGRLGVGLLYDLGGDGDHYTSLRLSQGAGALGIGGLYDDGGDDVYTCEAGCQGAGIHGIGVALDAAGDDSYTTWTNSQGFGYVRGVGLLYDATGTDSYLAQLTPVAYQSPQDPTVNDSMSQGAGFGRRADTLPDMVDMSGGMGVLRDAAGDDTYVASIFGQGSGYWSGMGFLLDASGNDHYDARWYVQGAAAHFAYGAMVDGGGIDIHNATAVRQNMTAGAGHDYSLGILLADGSDADTYSVPNLALGSGNDNGAGIFLDQGGDDTYNTVDNWSCGNAGQDQPADPTRGPLPTIGIFLDASGNDTYSRAGVTADPVQNNASWTQRQDATELGELGMGADGTTSNFGL